MKFHRFAVTMLLAAGSGTFACVGQGVGATAPVDVLIFKNGDQLQGTLLRGLGPTIVFKSAMAGEITVNLDQVKELRSGGSFAVLRKDAPESRQKVEPGPVVVEAGAVRVGGETVAGKDVGFVIDAVTYEKEVEMRPRAWEGWNGSVTLG